jgi:hypothetical protein
MKKEEMLADNNWMVPGTFSKLDGAWHLFNTFSTIRALTTEKDKRRFNVAVSRAKDQLWLFHTPTVDDLKNKADLRYQLLYYCKNPAKEILQSDRTRCENDFEASLFDQITAKGYKVIPQHNVAGFRIDLVIEGEKGRLAMGWTGKIRIR